MDCKTFSEQISLYIDNMLTEEEKEVFENHLRNCPFCQKELQDMQKAVDLLHLVESETELPEKANLIEDVLQKCEEKEEKVVPLPVKKKPFRYIAYVAAMLLIAVLSVPLLQQVLGSRYAQEDLAESAADRSAGGNDLNNMTYDGCLVPDSSDEEITENASDEKEDAFSDSADDTSKNSVEQEPGVISSPEAEEDPSSHEPQEEAMISVTVSKISYDDFYAILTAHKDIILLEQAGYGNADYYADIIYTKTDKNGLDSLLSELKNQGIPYEKKEIAKENSESYTVKFLIK